MVLVCQMIKALGREPLDLNRVGMRLAKASPIDYPCTWEWLGPGGLPGLQNLWRVALRAAVGSTPIHSRLILMLDDGQSTIAMVHRPSL